VHPDADQEVIEAAYRQLMKKHHPDVAGADPAHVAESHRRATEINRAFAVLRNPAERRRYDIVRQMVGTRRPHTGYQAAQQRPAPGATPVPPPPPPNAARAAPPPEEAIIEVPVEPGTLPAPLSWLATAYYLLPGRYEWERGNGRELLGTVLLPVIGTAAYALATGRLAPLIGHSLAATLVVWVLIGVLALPLLQSLPRVAIACGPGLVLLTGALNANLAQAHVPLWLAWAASALVALLVAARTYVFGFLPTLALCWLVSRI
jgi:hypothetical protein